MLESLNKPEIADIVITKKLPGFAVEPSMMFAYPTRLADLYTPDVERIYLPGHSSLDVEVTLSVRSGDTGPRPAGSLKLKAYQGMRKIMGRISTLDYKDKFVFDCRFDTDKNIAHVIDNTVLPVLFAQKVLSEYLGEKVEIHVILREKASNLARRVYETVGIPAIYTDDNVFGKIVNVSTNQLYSSIPELFNLDLGHKDTPDLIFVPRRGDRGIINNDEITTFLEQKGFVTYYFEDLTPLEQWQIMRNAKVIVIVHGAASVHMSFNRVGLENSSEAFDGVKILEIFSPAFVLRGRRYLASVLNGKWCAVRGQITPECLNSIDFKEWGNNLSPLLGPIKQPFKVDVNSIAMGLEYLQSGKIT